MLRFIKDSSPYTIKSKFTLIYILNCTDILFTFTLLKTGAFFEANVLMQSIVQNALPSIAIKVFFPAILIYFLFKHLDSGDVPNLKWCNLLIFIILSLYILVNLTHLYYVFTLFF